MEGELGIRPMSGEDIRYVVATWIASYREHASPRMVRRMTGGEYGPRWRALIPRLIERSKVLVAYSPEAPDTILGWIAYESTSPRRLHYMHVRREFQGLGIAGKLLGMAGIGREDTVHYSHETEPSRKLIGNGWEYSPWLLIGV